MTETPKRCAAKSTTCKVYRAEKSERRSLAGSRRSRRAFSFKAGQYARLAVDHDGKESSARIRLFLRPNEDGLEFFIELVPAGRIGSASLQIGIPAMLYYAGKFPKDASLSI